MVKTKRDPRNDVYSRAFRLDIQGVSRRESLQGAH